MSTVYRGFTQAELDAAYNNRAVEPRLTASQPGRPRPCSTAVSSISNRSAFAI